jgi:hypothetical protein
MIQERDITAVMPSLDSEDEFFLWHSGDEDISAQTMRPCRCVSLAHYTREMFSGITEVLDAM